MFDIAFYPCYNSVVWEPVYVALALLANAFVLWKWYNKNTVTIPVICNTFDVVKNKCADYDKQTVLLHLKPDRTVRPLDFYDEFVCFVEYEMEFLDDFLSCYLDENHNVVVVIVSSSLLYMKSQHWSNTRLRVFARKGEFEEEIATRRVRFKREIRNMV